MRAGLATLDVLSSGLGERALAQRRPSNLVPEPVESASEGYEMVAAVFAGWVRPQILGSISGPPSILAAGPPFDALDRIFHCPAYSARMLVMPCSAKKDILNPGRRKQLPSY